MSEQTSRTNITEALRRIRTDLAEHPCGRVYSGRPPEWTCLDSQREAASGDGRYSDDWRAKVASGSENCIRCDARLALAAEPSEPTGFDLRSNDVRPPRSDAVTAPDEPHKDYAGWTCSTGLMHAHAASDEPSTERLFSHPGDADWHEQGEACDPLIPHLHRKASPLIQWQRRDLVRGVNTRREARAAQPNPAGSVSLVPPQHDRIAQISGDIEHYDLSDDPGYIRIPTERLRSILAAAYAAETPEQGRGDE